jgi:hypothetical protein
LLPTAPLPPAGTQSKQSRAGSSASRRTRKAMSSEIFQEWRTADRAALAAEKVLLNSSLRSIQDGDSLAPTPADVERAHRLRAIANELFQTAMAEMNAEAERLKR